MAGSLVLEENKTSMVANIAFNINNYMKSTIPRNKLVRGKPPWPPSGAAAGPIYG
jgi:hypothetical protein